jgi:hypothetical protein
LIENYHVNPKSDIHLLIALKQNRVKGELPLLVYEKYGMETSKTDSYIWTTALCFNTAKLFRHQS